MRHSTCRGFCGCRTATALVAVQGPTGLVDVPATLLGLAGVSATGLDGESVLAALSGDRLREHTVYAETQYPRLHFGWSDLASAVDGRYHYIQAPRPELFDVSADSAERRNLAPNQPSTASALHDWMPTSAPVLRPPCPRPFRPTSANG